MPRPKRSKVAPSAGPARVARPMKLVAKKVLKGEVREGGFNDMYDVSDPDEDVVPSVRRLGQPRGKGKIAAAPSHNEPKSAPVWNLDREDNLSEPGEITTARELISLKNLPGGAGTEDIDLESSSPAVELGRREKGTPIMENSLFALGKFKRRPRQPSILGRAAARGRSSSIESNMAQDTGLTTIGRRNNSLMGITHSWQQGGTITGLGHEKSGSVGLADGTPTHAGSVLNLGNFRRRARQPSILGTAEKNRQSQPPNDDDNDDFNPEDESTPLHISKATDTTNSSSSNPKKRKLLATQGARSSPPVLWDRESDHQDDIPASGSHHHESEDEPQSSNEAPLPSVEVLDVRVEPMSETMAPPLSSSLSTSLEPEPASYRAAQRLRAEREAPRGRRRLRDRTTPSHTQHSPLSSPPSLTHSPNFRAPKAGPKASKRQAPPPTTLSTAQLQALLPRRRRRGARDPYDIGSEDEIDVSGLGSDDDELTHSNIRTLPSRRTTVPHNPAPEKAHRKSKVVPKPGFKKTYGTRAPHTTSDKENEEVDPDDSLAPLADGAADGSPENSQELEKRVGKELKKAARKFEEVDKWDLDFEDCTASSSSPKDAR